MTTGAKGSTQGAFDLVGSDDVTWDGLDAANFFHRLDRRQPGRPPRELARALASLLAASWADAQMHSEVSGQIVLLPNPAEGVTGP